jgi:hypothetical protein
MNRRGFLGALGATAVSGMTGCVSRTPVDFRENGVRIPPGDYYSYSIEIQDEGPAEPEMSYTVAGDEGDRFDVFVFAPEEFDRYTQALEGRYRAGLDIEEGISRSGVDENEISHTATMPEDRYQFVVDHTDVPAEMVGADVNESLGEPINVDIDLTVEYPGIVDQLPF